MRTLLVIFALLGVSYISIGPNGFLKPDNSSFIMRAMSAPSQTGVVLVGDPPDLFVPPARPPNYDVPKDLNRITKTFKTDGRSWHLYMPASRAEPIATVLLFHGASRNGLSMIDMWRIVADEHKLRLIALDGRMQNWPRDATEPAIVHRILNEAVPSFALGQHPIYLFGHSNGGSYVQRLLNETDGPWRAAAIHGGFADPAQAMIPAEPKPLRYYIGAREHIFKPDLARVVATGMADRGHNVDLQIIPQHTHWFYAGGPMIAADAWNWLSRH